ncbi:MAG TPA: hypothetical protein VG937_05385 [Polyangiaceae bacterium]|jgi:hypothetical protein|nr:hypothetical protein [Polyangiaceae bacterium]
MPVRLRARVQRGVAIALGPALLAACGGRTNEQPDPLPGTVSEGGATQGGANNTTGGAPPSGARPSGGQQAAGGRATGGSAASGAPSGARAGSGGRANGGTGESAAGSLGVGGGLSSGGFAGRFAGGGTAGSASGGGFAGRFAGGGFAGSLAGAGFAGSTAGSCTDSQGLVPLEYRGCRVDSDCGVLVLGSCCNRDRAVGIAATLMCTLPPVPCGAVDCDKVAGFVTDDGQLAASLRELEVRCQFVEPGTTLCRTTLTGNTSDRIPCGTGTCDSGELCVHRSARGGPAPRCTPVPADGACPPDTKYELSCNNDGPGCQELLLTPEPFCAPVPPGCGSPTACACLPPEICQSQVCQGVMGRQIFCQDQSA